jgi:hypothetical protein
LAPPWRRQPVLLLSRNTAYKLRFEKLTTLSEEKMKKVNEAIIFALDLKP